MPIPHPRRALLRACLALLLLASSGLLARASQPAPQTDPPQQQLYLPMLASIGTPDLEVANLTIEPVQTRYRASETIIISFTITNIGQGPSDPFWADVYFNPSRTPALNSVWTAVCTLDPCQGVSWFVRERLTPGQTITLTSAVGAFERDYSRWSQRLTPGTTTVMAYADSWNPGKSEGLSGDNTLANNLAVLRGLTVTP